MPALEVLPFPGTPDAAPGTDVDFLALRPSAIARITVSGSRSGLHAGRLRPQPGGQGTAFTPHRPFTPGERVSVTATLRSPAAGAASGAPGARRLRFSFGVARLASASAARRATDSPPDVTDARNAGMTKPLTHSFISQPHLHPPVVTIQGKAPDLRQGNIFLDAQNTGFPGPYILTPRGNLLYYRAAPTSVFNARVQSYKSKPVLTYWQGRVVPPGVGRGKDLIYNENYQNIHTVTAGNGYQGLGTDLHEFTLGRQGRRGTAFVTICAPTQADLTSVGGPPNGEVFDWIIQEIDIATDKVIWEWHALGHIPVSYSYERYIPGQTYDFFHLNSIQQLSNGHIIISARHTFGVYAIDRNSGRVLWELGGKHSNFSMGPGSFFEWQHDATLHKNGLLTLFDDNSSSSLGQSRGLELHISLGTHQASVVPSSFPRPHAILAPSQGSVQPLPTNDMFVGWGSSSHFAEYSLGGVQLFGGTFRGKVQSYRAYRFRNWVGNPLWPPAVAIRGAQTPGHAFLYASWDGSTRVKHWRVLGSSSKHGTFVKVSPSVKWASFETKIYIRDGAGPYFEVQALDSKRRVLPHGTSAPIRLP